MNDYEKGLAEKVMFAIYIDRQGEAETYYADYIAHTNFLGKKIDNKLLSKVSLRYANYQVKKAKEITEGNEMSLRM